MKRFVYPAVFYYDQATKAYCAAMKDLSLYIDGDTVEDAHVNIAEMLESYIKTALKYEMELPEPSSFDKMVEENPKELVMLVEYTQDEKKKQKRFKIRFFKL